MDERIDILDSDGNPTGRTAMKSEAHRKGWYHASVHVWLYMPNGQVLLQQRARTKETHPLLWDVSVAGHVGAGESATLTAVRETAEEVGLEIEESDLQFIGRFFGEHRHRDNLIDREFHYTYLCELRRPLDTLTKQDSEVEALVLMPLLRFSEETWGMAHLGKYVPHGTEYYKTVIQAIKKRL